VPREAGIESHLLACCKARGWWCLKLGRDGWPDRLIIWRPGRHFWVELKQPDGSLTAAQKVRIPKMRAAGEPVFIPDTRTEITELVEMFT
jgi:hypothetical protein